MLVVNRLPIASRGRPIGSVTTLRDRTELLELRRELDLTHHVTDTLRAQAHEFSNRLHTIAGLIELGEADEAVRFVHRVSSQRSELTEAVTVGRPRSVGRRAADRQGQPGRRAGRRAAHRARLLAAGAGRRALRRRRHGRRQPRRQRHGRRRHRAGAVGRGRARTRRRRRRRRGARLRRRACRRAWSARCSAAASRPRRRRHGPERGIGLSLVHLVCTRRGGSVAATSEGGSTFAARLPVGPALVRRMTGVLIVDDDFMVAKVHSRLRRRARRLRGRRHRLDRRRGARRGRAARARPRAARRLPARHDRPGGAAPAAGRRARRSDVIVISAARDVDSIRSALHGGVLHYLVKPFDRRDVRGPAARLRRACAVRWRSWRRSARATSTGSSAAPAGPPPRLRATPKGIAPETLELVRGALRRRRGRRALGHRVQRAHRPGAGERPALPRAAGGRPAGRRPAALRHGRAARAPVHPAGGPPTAAERNEPKRSLAPKC